MSIAEHGLLTVNNCGLIVYSKIMDADQLREVIMLAEKKNYAVAAEQLFISQSALSRHISQLEDKLGVQLFERSPRKVSLTRYGEALLPYAREMIAIEDKSLMVLAQLRQDELNSVRLGSIRGLSTYGVMSLITGFIADHNDISLNIDYAQINDLKEMLDQGRADAIITYSISDDDASKLRHLTIGEDRLVAVIPKGHPLASRRRLNIQDFHGTECVMQKDDRLMNRMISDLVRGSRAAIKKFA